MILNLQLERNRPNCSYPINLIIGTCKESTFYFWQLKPLSTCISLFVSYSVFKIRDLFTYFFSGDIVTFDNRRVIHNRRAYVVTESDNRHLEGAYLDWDEVRSRMRVIRQKIFNQKPLWSPPRPRGCWVRTTDQFFFCFCFVLFHFFKTFIISITFTSVIIFTS